MLSAPLCLVLLNPQIQNAFLNCSRKFFFSLFQAVHILRVNYEPTERDILYAEGDTSANGLAGVDFSFPQSEFGYENNTTDQHDSLLRYQLIRVGEGLGESCQWLETFRDAGLVIFCLSLSDYDQFSADGNSSITNKMLQSRAVFESIVTHPSFEKMNCLLLLSKFDLFVKKIARVPLTQCDWFDDFKPLLSYALGQPAYEYVAVKFKRLYSSLTDKKLYVSLVEDFEPDSVIGALKYSTEIYFKMGQFDRQLLFVNSRLFHLFIDDIRPAPSV
ncbi:putative guanine nucleotide binding protein (G-protein), alpha subunit [Rosa chinensis]|uniref:Putative guanine nucleotide binding protein (G-protein), alpha subunit n=1 Tax=Rosa chinensis TaxID=74649 RepID=A0A2P6SKH3_ROSCH|nr:putative guanine nucleotide binding protein (G-protein), alpha subunit [Rosa chinensis]